MPNGGVITCNVTIAKPRRADPFFGFTMPRSLPADLSRLDRQQYVYLIGAADRPGAYKIGVANNLARRLSDLSRGHPDGLHVAASRSVERVLAFQVERRVHEHFADRARGREWFNVEPQEALVVIDRWTRRARSALRYFKLLNDIPVI